MPLLENVRRQPTAADGALRIRRILNQAVTQMEMSLAQVRQVMQRHTPAAITSELSGDAAELKTIYNKIKTCVQAIDQARQIEDLPA